MFALDSVEYFNLLAAFRRYRVIQDVGASLLLVAARYCKETTVLARVVDPPAEWQWAAG